MRKRAGRSWNLALFSPERCFYRVVYAKHMKWGSNIGAIPSTGGACRAEARSLPAISRAREQRCSQISAAASILTARLVKPVANFDFISPKLVLTYSRSRPIPHWDCASDSRGFRTDRCMAPCPPCSGTGEWVSRRHELIRRRTAP